MNICGEDNTANSQPRPHAGSGADSDVEATFCKLWFPPTELNLVSFFLQQQVCLSSCSEFLFKLQSASRSGPKDYKKLHWACAVVQCPVSGNLLQRLSVRVRVQANAQSASRCCTLITCTHIQAWQLLRVNISKTLATKQPWICWGLWPWPRASQIILCIQFSTHIFLTADVCCSDLNH